MPKIKTALLIGLVLTLSIALIGCAGLFSQEDEPVQPLEAGEEDLPEWLLLASRQSESNDLRKDDNNDDLNDEDEEDEEEPVEEPAESAAAPAQTEPAPQPAPSSSSGQQTVQPSESTTATGYPGEIGSKIGANSEARQEAAKQEAAKQEAAANDDDWVNNMFKTSDDDDDDNSWPF